MRPRPVASWSATSATQWPRLGFCLVLLLALATPASVVSAGTALSGWRVSGTVNSFSLERSNTVVASAAWRYQMEKFAGGWRLKVESEANPRRPAQEFYCDGSNVVRVIRAAALGSTPQPVAAYPAGFPAAGAPVDLVWLAYGSGSYLDSGQRLAAPWLPALNDPRAMAFETPLDRYQAEPRLPRAVRFIARPASQTQSLTVAATTTRSLRFSDGVVVAEYRVTAATNWNGILVPWTFELDCQGEPVASNRTATNSQASSRARLVFKGQTQTIEASSIVEPFPPCSGPVKVSDRRFGEPGHESLTYLATNCWMLPANDPRLQELLRRQRAGVPARLTGSQAVGAVGLGFVLLSICALQTKAIGRVFFHERSLQP